MKPKIYTMPFATIYSAYINKAERKGRTQQEVDKIIFWLTGYNQHSLQAQLESGTDMETFFAKAPQIHPNASQIRGMICGYRVEDIQEDILQKIRYLDKLIDELAKGKTMEKILRGYVESTGIKF